MQTGLIKYLAILLTILMSSCPVLAQSDQSIILAEVNQYSQSMTRLENREGNKTLSEVYAEGHRVALKLSSVLESLSAEDYSLAKKDMKGFFVFREETVGVSPDMNFFKKLADQRGSREDIEFFSLMVDVYHNGTWPVFIEQQTDYSGCTSFGGGMLTKLYIRATQIHLTAQAAYQEPLKELIEKIQSELTSVACACGSADTVINELTLFVEKAPNAAIIEKVRNRLAAVKTGNTRDRFVCHSG